MPFRVRATCGKRTHPEKRERERDVMKSLNMYTHTCARTLTFVDTHTTLLTVDVVVVERDRDG